MSAKFVTQTALTLALTVMATAAYADGAYQPYYMQDNRDSIQYAQVAPPVPQNAPPSAPVSPHINTTEANQPALNQYNNEIWFSAGTDFLNYKESVKPIPDSEHGWMPSIAAGVDYMTHDNLYLAVDGSVDFGNTSYNGALFSSPSTHATGTTSDTIATIDAQIGQGLYLSDRVMAIPYLDGGFRYWNRNLGSDQVEKYHNFEALAGLKLEYEATDKLFVSGYASGGTTIGARMVNDNNDYDLGSSGVYKLGAKVGYDLSRQMEIFSTFDYDQFHYGHSPVVDSTLEPGSRTSDTIVRVGMGYHY